MRETEFTLSEKNKWNEWKLKLKVRQREEVKYYRWNKPYAMLTNQPFNEELKIENWKKEKKKRIHFSDSNWCEERSGVEEEVKDWKTI